MWRVLYSISLMMYTILSFSRPRSEGWPHHGRTFSIYLCPLSIWLTLPRRVLFTSWCCPSRPCMAFLTCVHLALFLALSLSPGNSIVHCVLLCNVLQFIVARCHDDYWVCDRLVVRILPPVTNKCATPLDEKFGCPAKEVPHLLNVAKELNINVVGVRWELHYLYYLYLLIETRHLGLFPNIALR